MKIALKASSRSVQGTGASRRLRRADKVPGIIYGGGKDASVIELDHNEIYHKLRLEAFHASILDMELDGKLEQVLLRDVQMHAWKQNVLHIDFQRIDPAKKIHMKVPLHFVNADISPGVKQSGGMVSHIINELNISCLPKDLPEFIEVDLKDLAAGHSIHISQLKLPAGVESIALHRKDDQSVATIIIPRAVASEEAETAAAAAAVSAADVPAVNQKVKEEEAPKKDDKTKK